MSYAGDIIFGFTAKLFIFSLIFPLARSIGVWLCASSAERSAPNAINVLIVNLSPFYKRRRNQRAKGEIKGEASLNKF